MRGTLVVACALIAATCLAVKLTWMSKATVHSLQASWSVTGKVPWGEAARDENNKIPVFIWRVVQGGYCYNAVYSSDIATGLATLRKATVLI